ncbi:MAG: magnesium transporter [Gammaproteobacteria bacterium]|jgi:magnesium transporter
MEARVTNQLSIYFLEEHPRESAKILEKYSSDELLAFFVNLSDLQVANLIRYLFPDLAVACLIVLPKERSAAILEQLGVDGASKLLSRISVNQQNEIINSMSRSVSHNLKQILKYPIGTIGHYMSPNIFIASEDMLVGEVINLAKTANSEILGDIFIIDDQQILVGVVDVKSLVFADASDEIQQLMKIPDTVFNVRTNLEYVKDNLRWRFKEVLPVVDQKNIFVGVLRRSIMNDILTGDQAKQDEIGIMETVIDIADLFWEVCFSFINPNSEPHTKAKVY